ncbi:MAG: ACT domain-containing protein, partial [Chloroflexi bacterium]|nr:ACT domain-containing protein [Chloroflexota bacterium]
MNFTLTLLPDHLAICQLPADAPFPPWARGENLFALVRTADELSVVCDDANLPEGIRTERGWRALKVHGPLDFSLVGVLAELATVLADAGVSIFAISTFDTDYLLVKGNKLAASQM